MSRNYRSLHVSNSFIASTKELSKVIKLVVAVVVVVVTTDM